MILGSLYHWSPADRHDSIREHGLLPGQPATVASEPQDAICCGVDPSGAWAISGASDWCAHIGAWDLWQVSVGDDDPVHVRPEYGPRVCEVRIAGPVPPERLWWVGRRSRGDDGCAKGRVA